MGEMKLQAEGESEEQSAVVDTAIILARKGVKLGDLLASPAFDGVREAVRDGVSSMALGMAEHFRQQMADTVKIGVSSLALGMAENLKRQMTVPIGSGEIMLRSALGLSAWAAEQQRQMDSIRGLVDSTWGISQWAAEQQQRQDAILAAFADMGRWQEPDILWPEVIPHPIQFGEGPTVPEVYQAASQITLESIDLALEQGGLSPAELEKLLQRYQRETTERLSPEIMFVALAYKEHGHKYDSQETFIAGYLVPKSFPISLATLKRWLVQYEAATGEHIGPGRGRRKRKLPKRRSM